MEDLDGMIIECWPKYAKTLINSDGKWVTCMSDSESQASLSQISLISRKKKTWLTKMLHLWQIRYGRSALIFYFILIFYKYIGILAIFSSIVQHIWLYFAHIAQLYYMWTERVYYRGPNATVFSSYSDLCHKTRSLGNLLITVIPVSQLSLLL